MAKIRNQLVVAVCGLMCQVTPVPVKKIIGLEVSESNGGFKSPLDVAGLEHMPVFCPSEDGKYVLWSSDLLLKLALNGIDPTYVLGYVVQDELTKSEKSLVKDFIFNMVGFQTGQTLRGFSDKFFESEDFRHMFMRRFLCNGEKFTKKRFMEILGVGESGGSTVYRAMDDSELVEFPGVGSYKKPASILPKVNKARPVYKPTADKNQLPLL